VNSKTNGSHGIREELRGIVIFIAAIWAVFMLEVAVPQTEAWLGLVPRTLRGTIGIVGMPLVHASLGHLVANTIPLAVLLALLAGSRAESWQIVAGIVVIGGALLWAVGRPAIHVGASGLIFGLIAFLILSGLLEKRPVPLLVSLIVAVFYGGTLVWGMLPLGGGDISWDGHLCGAAAGVLSAYGLSEPKPPQ
jgi:membrane associated rhomboid family serine protease